MIPEHLLKEHWPTGCPTLVMEKDNPLWLAGDGGVVWAASPTLLIGDEIVLCAVAICWHERMARLAASKISDRTNEYQFEEYVILQKILKEATESAAMWRDYLDTLWEELNASRVS